MSSGSKNCCPPAENQFRSCPAPMFGSAPWWRCPSTNCCPPSMNCCFNCPTSQIAERPCGVIDGCCDVKCPCIPFENCCSYDGCSCCNNCPAYKLDLKYKCCAGMSPYCCPTSCGLGCP